MTLTEIARALVRQTFPHTEVITFGRDARTGRFGFILYGPDGARPSATLLPADRETLRSALEPVLRLTSAQHLTL